jgi:hypothetical protein
MDVQASDSRVPTLYQRPVAVLQASMPRVPSFYPEDVVDCVEIRTGHFLPTSTVVTHYVSSAGSIKEKGSLIDLFV